MNQDPLPKPTDAELAILQVLWDSGPSTVRQVQESLNQMRPTGYTTVLKLLQIMVEKGLVVRDESQRAHIYRTILSEEQTQTQLIDRLLERAFEGSTAQLVLRALSAKKTTGKELEQIRKMLDEVEGGQDV